MLQRVEMWKMKLRQVFSTSNLDLPCQYYYTKAPFLFIHHCRHINLAINIVVEQNNAVLCPIKLLTF